MAKLGQYIAGTIGKPVGIVSRGSPAPAPAPAPSGGDGPAETPSVFDSASIRLLYRGSAKRFTGGSRSRNQQGNVIWYENMPALFGTGAFSMLAVATVNGMGGGNDATSSSARDMVNTEYNRVGFRVGTDRVICFLYNGAYRQVYRRIRHNRKYGFLMVADGVTLYFHVSDEATRSTPTGPLQYYQELFEIGGGNKNYPNSPFDGEIHDFAIWKRALSSADLAAMKSETQSLHGIQW